MRQRGISRAGILTSVSAYPALLLCCIALLLATALSPRPARAGGGGGISIADNNTHIDRGTDYTSSAFLTASGGTAPYTFNVTAGLPSGIVVNSDGSLTGVTCGTNGSFRLTVSATDSGGNSGTSTTATLIVNAAPGGCGLSLTSSTLPTGSIGSAYSASLSATGGTAPYHYTVASGSLPPGVTLSSSGTFSGTPTTAGTYSFTLFLTDSASGDGAQTLSMTIASGPAPVAGNVSQTIAYNPGSASATPITLSLSGGTATSVAVATSPSHGTATASGTAISYTPTAHYNGSDSFTYTATNSNGTSSAATVSITVSAPTITVSPTSLTAPTTGTAYSQSLSASGGFGPYTYAITSGSLPAGLSLSSGGVLSGTPTSSTSYTFTVTATDSSSGTAATGSRSYSVTVSTAAPIAGSVSQTIAYNSGSASSTTINLSLSGGTATSVTVASNPTHGTATASGTSISYTPTAHYSGSDSFTYTATNTGGTSSAATVTLTISAPTLSLSPTTLSAGTAATAYSQSVTASGGFAPYTYSITSGTLPTGLTLSSAGTLSGTPTTSGTYNFTITATDSTTGTAATVGQAYSLTINTAGPAVPVAGSVTQSVSYNSGSATPTTISLNLSGGAATSVSVSGAASHGSAVASGTSITYTPTAHYIGADSFTYTATNTSGTSSPATVSITVTAPTVTIAPTTLPTPTVGTSYTQTVSAVGGQSPYTYAVTSGSLPAGLTLSSSTGVISGTPTTAGAVTFTITATDSSTGTPATASASYSFTVGPAAPTAGSVSQTIAYNSGSASSTAINLSLGGGTATSVTVASNPTHGTATASGASISYTPTAHYSGNDSFTYTATNTGGTSSAATVTLTISAPTLSLSPTTLPAATAATAYSQSVTASGGFAPYSYSVTSGTLPTGLTLSSAGTLSGTPTTSGTYNFTITATDSTTGTAATVGHAYSLTVNTSSPAIPIAGGVTQTVAYNSGSASATAITLNLSGGAAASVAVSGAATHGSAIASGTSITYTPTAHYIGADSFTYTATNTSGTSSPATVSITVSGPTVTMAPTNLPAPTVGTSYTQTVSATGGQSPYTYAITAGSLPAGLTLNTTTGTISGTPTGAGSATFTITATDSSSGTPATVSQSYTVTVSAAVPSAPVAGGVSQSVPYNAGSASPTTVVLSLTGGAPTSVAISSTPTHGTASVTGTSISYTPTAHFVGTDTFTYTASNGGGTSSPATVTVTVTAPTLSLSPTSLPAATAGTAYSQTLTTTGGTAPYTYSLSSGALPAGITLGSNGTLSGTAATAASATFTVTVTDSSSGTVVTTSHSFTLTINAAAVAAPSAAGVAQNITYNSGSATPTAVTINLSGGTATAVAIVTQPSHGTATASGTSITYTPTARYVGTDSFTYTASNTSGTSAPATVTLTIAAPALNSTPAAAPPVLTQYTPSAPFTPVAATGGVSPLAFSVEPSLPAGLTLNPSTGEITGTPSVPLSDTTYTMTVTDAVGQRVKVQFRLQVAAPALTITPTTLPAAREGSNFTVALTVAGGTGPYTWSIGTGRGRAGSLPTGLTLSSAGVLSGKPLVTGSFTIKVTDALGTVGTQSYDLTVNPRPDPTADSSVRGQLAAQAEMAKHFAMGQVSNISSHLDQVRDGLDPCTDTGSIGLNSDTQARITRSDDPLRNTPAVRPEDSPEPNTNSSAAAANKSDSKDADRCLNRALFGSGSMALWVGGSLDRGATNVIYGNRNYFSTSGLTLGLDDQITKRLLLGVAVGRGWEHADIDSNGTETHGTSTSGILYATFRHDRIFSFDAILGYGHISTSNTRWVEADGTWVDGGRSGSNLLASLSATASLGHPGFRFDPFVRATYLRSRWNAYSENGPTDLALTYAGTGDNSLSITAGFSMSRDFAISARNILTPLISLQQQRTLDVTQSQTLYYSDLGPDLAYYTNSSALPQSLTTGQLGIRFHNLSGLETQLSMDYSLGSLSYMTRSYRATFRLPL